MTNPLQRHFRKPKLYISLPSQGKFYKNGEIDLAPSSELGILPMTSRDEMMLKNPDALLNGEALVELLKSCCPSVKIPTKILKNDVDAISLAIKAASYGDELDVQVVCPECNAENKLGLSISALLNRMTFLENEYKVETNDGLSVYVKPFTLETKIKAMLAAFEESKLFRTLKSTEMSEQDKITAFSKSFRKLAELNFNLIADSIIKVDETEEKVSVNNKEHILEFLTNTDKDTVKSIEDKVGEVNEVGLPNEFETQCQSCNHVWKAELELDPVNFFTGS